MKITRLKFTDWEVVLKRNGSATIIDLNKFAVTTQPGVVSIIDLKTGHTLAYPMIHVESLEYKRKL